jgi:hypothetical protein
VNILRLLARLFGRTPTIPHPDPFRRQAVRVPKRATLHTPDVNARPLLPKGTKQVIVLNDRYPNGKVPWDDGA